MTKLEKAIRKQNNDNMEWALFALLKENESLRKTVEFYRKVTEILANPERFPGRKRRGKR